MVAFVSNAGWIESKAADGMRKCVAEDFTSINVFHLRGNQRTQGDRSRREGGKIFGQGSRAAIAITVLVRNPAKATRGSIRFHDIGDYLSRDEKLGVIEKLGSMGGIERHELWQSIVPNDRYDWLAQRDEAFQTFIPMGDKKDKSARPIFSSYSSGVKTNRDAWAYNPSRRVVEDNMARMVAFYHAALRGETTGDLNDPKRISWSWLLRERFGKKLTAEFDARRIRISSQRPFMKAWLYYDGFFNENRYLMPSIFPDLKQVENRVIMVKQRWGGQGNLALMLDAIPALQTDGGDQSFPRYLFEAEGEESRDDDLFRSATKAVSTGLKARDAITDDALDRFSAAYPRQPISKDDIFHYVYGILHSEDYLDQYNESLTKELPRIPFVKDADDFWSFSRAGKALGELHVNYEAVEPYPVQIKQGDLRLANIADPAAFFRVEKMKFGGKRGAVDKGTVTYNANITMTGIPTEAYDYIINGKPAIEWVMERQCVKTDAESGIISDANLYAAETVGDPMYPLLLFQRMITVSLETMKIVRSLPSLGELS